MKKLNLDQKMMMKSISVLIVQDPYFVKNAIIKSSKTHKLKPDNEYLCELLKPIFDKIEERTDFYNETYLNDLTEWIELIEHDEVKKILIYTLDELSSRNQ